jgi:hypothetical protein
VLRRAGLVARAARRRIVTWLGNAWRWLVETLSGLFGAVLGLTDLQQRALMTWALIGGIVAISGGVWWGIDQLVALVPPSRVGAETLAIIHIIGDVVKLLVILIGLMAGGIVLIARGGEMTVKGPGGLEISARGAGAQALAARTDIVDVAKGDAPASGEQGP